MRFAGGKIKGSLAHLQAREREPMSDEVFATVVALTDPYLRLHTLSDKG